MSSLLAHRIQLINKRDQRGFSPLLLAIREERFDIAKTLLSYGADPKIGGGPLGSCLHLAVLKMRADVVKELLRHGASACVKDHAGNTPLHLLSLIYSHGPRDADQIASMLVASGADINAANNESWTPVHLAV